MFEKLLEKADFRKYDLGASHVDVLTKYIERDEFIEIGVSKSSLLGIKNHSGKEVLHVNGQEIANFLRLIRDQFGEWEKLCKISFQTERQFNLHANKSFLMDMVRSKLGVNFTFNKSAINKKMELLNQKLHRIHERLQGVFIVCSEICDLITGFDSRSSVFAVKTSNEESITDIEWIKDLKKSNLLVICPDNKQYYSFLTKYGCEKLRIGRSRNKNIWLRQQ